jgi:hypothetical protein
MKSASAEVYFFCARHSMTAPIPSAPMALDPVAAVEDWEALLRAVTTRLRLLVGDPTLEPDTDVPPGGTSPLRTGVLECAAALDQLVELISQQMPEVAPRVAKRRRGDSAE